MPVVVYGDHDAPFPGQGDQFVRLGNLDREGFLRDDVQAGVEQGLRDGRVIGVGDDDDGEIYQPAPGHFRGILEHGHVVALLLPRRFQPGGVPVANRSQLETAGRGDLIAVVLPHAEQRPVSHQSDADGRSVGHPADVPQPLDQLVLKIGVDEGPVVVAKGRIEYPALPVVPHVSQGFAFKFPDPVLEPLERRLRLDVHVVAFVFNAETPAHTRQDVVEGRIDFHVEVAQRIVADEFGTDHLDVVGVLRQARVRGVHGQQPTPVSHVAGDPLFLLPAQFSGRNVQRHGVVIRQVAQRVPVVGYLQLEMRSAVHDPFEHGCELAERRPVMVNQKQYAFHGVSSHLWVKERTTITRCDDPAMS